MGTTNKSLSQGAAAAADAGCVYPMRNRVSLVGLATGEVVNCLKIPAGTTILQVMTRIVTPESTSGACTAKVGRVGADDSFDASIDLKAVAGTVAAGVGGTDAGITAHYTFLADGYIDLTITINAGPAAACVVEVMALCLGFQPIAGRV